MREFIITLLFKLLGNQYRGKQYDIPYLFGATTIDHSSRKKRWNKSLIRLYRDKAMIDFLLFQSEQDKENVFRNKIDRRISQGARIRTLFLVHSARRAHLMDRKRKRSRPDDTDLDEQEISTVEKVYKKVTSVE